MRTAIPFFGKILFGGYSSVKIKVKSALVIIFFKSIYCNYLETGLIVKMNREK
jgi:hypothetical protein